MGNKTVSIPPHALINLAARIRHQAECLVHYAEQDGNTAKPVPSVYHSQTRHFEDLARELQGLASLPTEGTADAK